MGVFDRQIETAKRVISAKGELVTWRKLGTATSDSAKPWVPSSNSNADYEARILFLTVNRMGYELLRYLKGSEVTTGSVKGLMASVDFELAANDVVIRGDKTLRIRSIDPLSPNGQIILYTLEFNE